MENSLLLSLVHTLSNKEIREIRQFLRSPFFNRREEVTELFDYLVECLKRLKVIPAKEKAYQHITSGQNDYDDQQMRLWMSFLLKGIEQYLVHTALFDEQVMIRTQLTEIYRVRNLPKHRARKMRELEQLQKKPPYRNAGFYENEFRVQLEKYRHASASRRMSELNLQKMSDRLDVAYFSRKLRQSCLALSHQAVYKTDYHFGLTEEILRYIERQKMLDIPAIAVYYYGFQTLSQPPDSGFFPAFKKAITDFGEQFPPEELGDLYLLAINFCIKRYNEGDQRFIPDEFELYRQGLEQGLFLKQGILSRFTYRNIVTLGLVLKEFTWVEKFILEYKNALDKAYRESMFSFSLARLEYSRKNYKAALHLLQKSEYKDLLLNLAAKTVLLKIFYELDEFDLLAAHLDAMRAFIRRKKIMGYHRKNYLNLVYFTRKLMERNPYDRTAAAELRQEIEAEKAVAEKGWLLASIS